jgi:hypothetical protein
MTGGIKLTPAAGLPTYVAWARIFLSFKEPKNRFQGTNSARLCSVAGRYDNPIPTRILAPINCLKIPALAGRYDNPLPKLTLYPPSGTMNWASVHLTKITQIFQMPRQANVREFGCLTEILWIVPLWREGVVHPWSGGPFCMVLTNQAWGRRERVYCWGIFPIAEASSDSLFPPPPTIAIKHFDIEEKRILMILWYPNPIYTFRTVSWDRFGFVDVHG